MAAFAADRLHLLCLDVKMLSVVEPDADLIGVGVQGKLRVPLIEAIELFFVAGLALRVAQHGDRSIEPLMLNVTFAARHIHIEFLPEGNGKSTPAVKAMGLKQIVRFVEKMAIQAFSAVLQGGFWRRRGVQPTVIGVHIMADSAIRLPVLVASYPVMETQFTRRDVNIRFILQEQRRADNHPTAEKDKQGQHITLTAKAQLWLA